MPLALPRPSAVPMLVQPYRRRPHGLRDLCARRIELHAPLSMSVRGARGGPAVDGIVVRLGVGVNILLRRGALLGGRGALIGGSWAGLDVREGVVGGWWWCAGGGCGGGFDRACYVENAGEGGHRPGRLEEGDRRHIRSESSYNRRRRGMGEGGCSYERDRSSRVELSVKGATIRRKYGGYSYSVQCLLNMQRMLGFFGVGGSGRG